MMEDKRPLQSDNVGLVKLEFEDIKQPYFYDDKGKGYVWYGEKNDYPNYLLDLFDKSGKHAAIIRGKTDFIIGNGFAFKDDKAVQNKKVLAFIDRVNNDGESLEEVTAKVTTDLEIFGGGYFEILFNKLGKISEIYHLDFTSIRLKKDGSMFYYAPDWQIKIGHTLTQNGSPTITEIKPFDLSNPKGKQILFIKEYKPFSDVYPTPNYFAALRYIQIDISIGEYHLNGITNGMFASKLINFNNGVPKIEDQKAIETKVNKKFAGSKNAGKIMLSFNKSGDNAPTVLDLSGTELDKHFDLLNKTTEAQIFSSHRVTSPSLFGIRETGKLGGANENLREAFELFDNTYISAKRKIIERNINLLLSVNGISPVYLQRSEPVGIVFDAATIAKALTQDEIRERLGLKPLTQEQILKQAPPVVTPPPTAKFEAEVNEDLEIETFEKFGKKKADFVLSESRAAKYNEFDFAETSMKIMYSYEGVRDAKNRPFCARLLDLDKIYTRQDIEQISAIVGYSVWHRRGGWYKPKGASEARNYCRHNWQAYTITTNK